MKKQAEHFWLILNLLMARWEKFLFSFAFISKLHFTYIQKENLPKPES